MQRKTEVARIARKSYRCFLVLIGLSVAWSYALGADKPSPKISSQEACPRRAEGSTVEDAHDRVSKNGLLELTLKVRSSIDENGNPRYCYIDENGNYSPTLRVQPGDALVIHLKNEISLPPTPGAHAHMAKTGAQRRNPCDGGEMSASSMNLHFHGLAIPPVCHQDETLKTVVQPGDPAFEYRVRIPKSQPPGLYWYHPHVHGFSEEQLLGGASGALIVEGTSRAVSQVAGLTERVLVIRDEKMPAAAPGDKPDPNRPTKQISINNIPVPYPKYPTAVIKMRPGERQFWRVLNASADTYVNLAVEYDSKRQLLGLVSLDGVPLRFGEPDSENYVPEQTDIFLSPAGRAEFIITGPPEGVTGRLATFSMYRGADEDGRPAARRIGDQPALRIGQDDNDPFRPLATIVASSDASNPRIPDASSARGTEMEFQPLSGVRPTRKRTLFFSEKLVNPDDPKSATQFFITEDGRTPAIFDPAAEPNITVHQGDVEDWTIENRSREVHTFHVHQLHFLVVGRRGTSWEAPSLRDTVNLAAWSGFGSYPSITVRMDFRNPRIVGTFPFHCHILQHLDGGMMGTVRVEPAEKKAE